MSVRTWANLLILAVTLALGAPAANCMALMSQPGSPSACCRNMHGACMHEYGPCRQSCQRMPAHPWRAFYNVNPVNPAASVNLNSGGMIPHLAGARWLPGRYLREISPHISSPPRRLSAVLLI